MSGQSEFEQLLEYFNPTEQEFAESDAMEGEAELEQFLEGMDQRISSVATPFEGMEQEDFLWGWFGGSRIEDRTHFAPKNPKKMSLKPRDPSTVYALVLHQMAFSRGNDPKKYDTVGAHYTILPDGKITQLHPISRYVYSSNGFNAKSVAVEFAGNFSNTKGKCWEAKKFGCHKLTQAQIDSGRYLVKHLVDTIGLTHILAHRQSSGQRENDPGPDIWFHVGQWAVENLGLKDGGPGFSIGSGKPIPDAWRNWKR